MIIEMPTYNIILGENKHEEFNKYIKDVYSGNKLFIITDEKIFSIYKDYLKETFKEYEVNILIAGDKNFANYQKIIEELLIKEIKKDDLIISFGGGSIGDLAGFIASTVLRGVKYVQIPTTLLSQVDSSIGGKTAIDSSIGKNLVGSFYNPELVLIDTFFLKTLSYNEYKNGYAEAIKMALSMDSEFYNTLRVKKYLSIKDIKRAIELKKRVVLIDPYDKKERQILNFGHTFGHAIEKESNYSVYSHGEAISYGMLIALEIGIDMGITPKYIYDDLHQILLKNDLIGNKKINKENYIEDIKYDKKNREKGLNFILIEDVGKAIIKRIKVEKL